MKKAVRTLAVAAASVLALSGCAESPARVATIDGTPILESSVERANQALIKAGAVDPEGARRDVALVLIRAAMSEKIAAKRGVVITAAEREAQVGSSPAAEALKQQPGGPELIRDIVTVGLVLDKVGTDTYVADAAAMNVDLNPRYGAWNPTSLELVGSGSLSKLAEPNA